MVIEVTPTRQSWRIRLGRKITWLLALKFVTLLVLWALFFSPGQRVNVSPTSSAEHLSLHPKGPAQ
jgi:hypothetical protein